jgi:predicted neutral ceramidase superfamily lipid hydrolase
MKWLQRGSVGIAEDDTIITAYLLEEATTVYLLVVIDSNPQTKLGLRKHFVRRIMFRP